MSEYQTRRLVQFCLFTGTLVSVFYAPKLAIILAYCTGWHGHKLEQFKRAMEVVEYRRERKAKITARIARALVREYKAYGDIEKAIEQQMVRNWIGFEASWIKKPHAFTDQNHPTPRLAANYGPAEIVTPPKPMSPEEQARRAAMVQRLREEGVLGRTMQ